jgi:hypothetical protein
MGNKTLQVSSGGQFEIYTHKVKNDGTLATKKEVKRRKKIAEFVQQAKNNFEILKEKVEPSLVTNNFFVKAKEDILVKRRFAQHERSNNKNNNQIENEQNNQNISEDGVKKQFESPLKANQSEFPEEVQSVEDLSSIDKCKEIAFMKSNRKGAKSKLKPINESEESFEIEEAMDNFSDEFLEDEGKYNPQKNLENKNSFELILKANKQFNQNSDFDNINKNSVQHTDESSETKGNVRKRIELNDLGYWETAALSDEKRFITKQPSDDPFINNILRKNASQYELYGGKDFLNQKEVEFENSLMNKSYQEINLASYLQQNSINNRSKDEELIYKSKIYSKQQNECTVISFFKVSQ